MKNILRFLPRCRLLLAVFCLFNGATPLRAQWVNINVVPGTSSIYALCFATKDTNLFCRKLVTYEIFFQPIPEQAGLRSIQD